MRLKFQKKYWIGISAALLIVIFDFLLFFDFWAAEPNNPVPARLFYPLIVIALTVSWIQFWIDFYHEQNRQKEIEQKFLEFVRNLVGTVKSGIPIPRAVTQIANKDYGALTPYAKKLAAQVEWGITIDQAFLTFSDDTANPVIKRAVSIMIEAEKSGGDIAEVLDAIAASVVDVKKMKQERKSSTYGQIMQGYIVFYIFIAIMLVLQIWLFPKLAGMSGGLQSGLGALGGGMLGGGGAAISLDGVFFALIMIQGFFAGIMVGKFSEGSLKQGLIHSLIMITTAALIITTAKGGI